MQNCRILLVFIGLQFAIAVSARANFEEGWIEYLEGRYNNAYSIWLPLAEKGHAPSQLNLGILLDQGLGVKTNQEAAVAWFEQAAEQEYSPAIFNLGKMYQKGRGVVKDHTKATSLFQTAAKFGNSYGQYSLGMAYLRGEGISKNVDEGVSWLKAAADHGNSLAQFELGQIYEMGLFVERNLNKALEFYQIAAENGSAPACHQLGMLHYKESGDDQFVGEDLIKSFIWFSLALKYGYNASKEPLLIVQSMLTTEQESEANALLNSLYDQKIENNLEQNILYSN